MCDVECGFSDCRELYFEVNDAHGDWLTADVYDAFLVAALYPCQCYNEPIIIEGNVTQRVYINALNYAEALIHDFRPSFHKVDIKVNGFAETQQNKELHVGTGFSGGVDSFSTLHDWFYGTKLADYKIDTLFFFHVGQYGNVRNPKTQERAENRYELTKNFAKIIGVDSVMMNTNLFDFYKPEWEYDAGALCRITSVLVFQKALKRYYISSAYAYGEAMSFIETHSMPDHSEAHLINILSTPKTDIIFDGAQHLRSEKTKNILNDKLAQKFLNVCVYSSNDNYTQAKNCGFCPKCMRTQMTLECLDSLDKFNHVFNKQVYLKHAFRFKCQQVLNYKSEPFARDLVDLARAHNKPLPPYWLAFLRIKNPIWFIKAVKRKLFG